METKYVLLDTAILTGYVTIIGIGLMIASVWIFKLKMEIREIKKRLPSLTGKHENSYDFSDKKDNRGSD